MEENKRSTSRTGRGRVAVVGSGVSGLVSAYQLSKTGFEVTLFEKDSTHVGGHAWTIDLPSSSSSPSLSVDVGFQVLNHCTYPNLLRLFEELGVELEASDMSFAVDVPGLIQWGSNSLKASVGHGNNSINPKFWKMILDMTRFKKEVEAFLEKNSKNLDALTQEVGLMTLGEFLERGKYSETFIQGYVLPMCACIWSTATEEVLHFPAFSILNFMKNHHLLQLTGRPQWLTVKGRSRTYVDRITQGFKERIRMGTAVERVEEVTSASSGRILRVHSTTEVEGASKKAVDEFDFVVMATHAPETLAILGDSATEEEKALLSEFQYKSNDIYLHSDPELMPRDREVWSAWNFMGCNDLEKNEKTVYCSYYENLLQGIPEEESKGGRLVIVTLNPPTPPKPSSIICRWTAAHPIPTVASYQAQLALDRIQGKRGIYFAGAYLGWGFHEDGCKSGLHAAALVCGETWKPLPCVPAFSSSMTWAQTGARLVVTQYLSNFIQEGEVELREQGGQVYRFGKPSKGETPVLVEVLNPAFYTSVARRFDLGFADAHIDGHIKCDLFQFFTLMVRNRDRAGGYQSFLTSAFDSWRAWMTHTSRSNTVNNTKKNISEHYDLSNDLFQLFLDPTMMYSSAYFTSSNQRLEDAQKTKIEMLCRKAQVARGDLVLEIGAGWGSLAIHLASEYDCQVIGLTLSEEQKRFAEKRVREAKLDHLISFELIDYRSFARDYKGRKFDRIISCEMLEAVGSEYFGEFFKSLDELLVPNGVVSLQYIAMPDQRWDAYRTSVDFIQERIFPGGCLPCISALTTAMKQSSNLILQELQEFGPHYARTLEHWRANFLSKTEELEKLGFDIKFRRTWDYYFEYCRAGFATNTLLLHQVVLTRPGNTTAFNLTTKNTAQALAHAA